MRLNFGGFSIFFAVILCLNACGGGGGDGNPVEAGIESTTPADEETQVRLNAPIVVRFLRPVKPRSVTTATFFVTANGRSIPGSVESSALEAVFTPDVSLPPAAECRATLGAEIRFEGGGSLGSDYEWAFSTKDGAWNTAQLLTQYDASQAPRPAVSMDNAGGAVAIWSTTAGLFAANYDRSIGWSGETLVDSVYLHQDYNGNIALASDCENNAMAVWGAGRRVIARRYKYREGWEPAEIISAYDDENINQTYFGYDRDGNGLMLYSNWHPMGEETFYRRYTVASGWERALPSAGGGIERWGTDLFLDRQGVGTFARGDSNMDRFTVYRYSPERGWVLSLEINPLASMESRSPKVAGDGAGNYLFVVWKGPRIGSSDLCRIYINRYIDGVGWNPVEILSEQGLYRVDYTYSIGADSFGNAIVAWEESDGIHARIQARRFVDGSGWTPATAVGGSVSGDERNPKVVVDPYGNAVAVWIQGTGNGLKVYANRFVPAIGWIGAQPIDVDGAGDSSNLSLAANDYGQIASVWAHDDGHFSTIYANRFD